MTRQVYFKDGATLREVSKENPLPVTGGGGSGGGGLTDAELRASPVPVSGPATNAQLRASPIPMVPMLTGSGNIEMVGLAAAAVTQCPAQACKQASIANFSNSPGWVIQGGKKFPLFPMAYFSFFGITNTNQLEVQLTEVGDVYIHWES